jgi:hypothetical protein
MTMRSEHFSGGFVVCSRYAADSRCKFAADLLLANSKTASFRHKWRNFAAYFLQDAAKGLNR